MSKGKLFGSDTEGKFKVEVIAVEVIADSSGKWSSNLLRFATREEAEAYAKDLTWRWTSVREWRIVEDPAR